jgi:hypothetical protein
MTAKGKEVVVRQGLKECGQNRDPMDKNRI